MVNAIDFSRSFVTFRIDLEAKPPQTVSHEPPFNLNMPRIQLECRCLVVDKGSGAEHRFAMGANCKTERVGVDRDIWLAPNADFRPIFSDSEFLNIKTYPLVGMSVDFHPPRPEPQPERQHGISAEAFDGVSIDFVEREAQRLTSAEEIVEATLANRPLVATTTIESDRYQMTLDYPVRTMNANNRHWVYQTDTGPLLYPDLNAEPNELLPTMQLAYGAFNCPDWIEMIIRRPTDVGDGLQVHHYNEPVRHQSQNRVAALID